MSRYTISRDDFRMKDREIHLVVYISSENSASLMLHSLILELFSYKSCITARLASSRIPAILHTTRNLKLLRNGYIFTWWHSELGPGCLCKGSHYDCIPHLCACSGKKSDLKACRKKKRRANKVSKDPRDAGVGKGGREEENVGSEGT